MKRINSCSPNQDQENSWIYAVTCKWYPGIHRQMVHMYIWHIHSDKIKIKIIKNKSHIRTNKINPWQPHAGRTHIGVKESNPEFAEWYIRAPLPQINNESLIRASGCLQGLANNETIQLWMSHPEDFKAPQISFLLLNGAAPTWEHNGNHHFAWTEMTCQSFSARTPNLTETLSLLWV